VKRTTVGASTGRLLVEVYCRCSPNHCVGVVRLDSRGQPRVPGRFVLFATYYRPTLKEIHRARASLAEQGEPRLLGPRPRAELPEYAQYGGVRLTNFGDSLKLDGTGVDADSGTVGLWCPGGAWSASVEWLVGQSLPARESADTPLRVTLAAR